MPVGNDMHPSQRHPPEGLSQFQRRSMEQDVALVPVMKEERDEINRDGGRDRENAKNRETAPEDGPGLSHPLQARTQELKELSLPDRERERGLSNIRRQMASTDSGQVVKQTAVSAGTPTWLTDAVLRMQARQASEAAAAAEAHAAAVEAEMLKKRKNCACPIDAQACLCGALNENYGGGMLGLTSSQAHRGFGFSTHWLSMPTARGQIAFSGHRQDHDNACNRTGQYDNFEEGYGQGQESRQAQEAEEHAEADNSSDHNDVEDHEANWLVAKRKADIVSHHLFPELLSAHVACLRIATPVDQLPTIDAQLALSHLVISKYQVINIESPDDNFSDKDELEQYMTDSVMLLRSFRDQLQQHVRVHAMEAVMACFDVEKQLEDLTGVRLGESVQGSSAMMSDDDDDVLGDDPAYTYDPVIVDGNESGGYGPLIPSETERTLMERVRQELKSELKQEPNALSSSFVDVVDETGYAGGGGSSGSSPGEAATTHRHKSAIGSAARNDSYAVGLLIHELAHVYMQVFRSGKIGYRAKIIDVREEILRKRRAGKLPGDTTTVLKTWWHAHAKWPYPTEDEKARLVQETGLELKQINNWFINQRKRNWHANPSAAAAKTKRKR